MDDKGLTRCKSSPQGFFEISWFQHCRCYLAASCKMPVRKAIPYANKPENIVPGVSKYYATTYVQDGDVMPILAKVRDGRPIKIEGNDECTYYRRKHLQEHRLLYWIFMIPIV